MLHLITFIFSFSLLDISLTLFSPSYSYYSEFNSDSCVKVVYTKKEKFAKKIAYVQDNFFFTPVSKTLHRRACDACDKFQVWTHDT